MIGLKETVSTIVMSIVALMCLTSLLYTSNSDPLVRDILVLTIGYLGAKGERITAKAVAANNSKRRII